jgi:hypothetical protein
MGYSYSNSLVGTIEAYYAERVQEISEATPDERVEGNIKDAQAIKYGGVYIREELLEFVNALAPLGYKFAPSTDSQYVYMGNGTYMYQELEVYREGDEYTMGRIGYANTGHRNNPKMMYTVYSRVIKNGKIRPSNWRYNVKASAKLSLAIKHAKMFLRIFSPHEVCSSSLLAAVFQARSELSDAQNRSASMSRDILYSSKEDVMKVLLSVHRGEVAMLPAAMKEKLEEYRTYNELHKEELNRIRPAYHVNIHGLPNAQRASIIEVANIADAKYSYGGIEQVDNDTPVTVVDVADIPEDIMGRIAVLSMNADGHYISGLGFKVSSKSYWIEREGM